MAMKKAEMERHAEYYKRLISKARKARKKGLFREALDAALASWGYIDGMMQFERRYNDREFVSIEGIDMALELTPFLLEFDALAKLDTLLKERRRIDKNTSESMIEKLDGARLIMKKAHRMWNYLEQHGSVQQDTLAKNLGGDQAGWRSIAESWEVMGLVRRFPEGRSYKLQLSTRLGAIVSGKCPSCGKIVQGPKAMLIEESRCPGCTNRCVFVLLAEHDTAYARE